MAYNQYGDPYAANPPGQYGAREGEDYSTPSYAHQPLEYNSYAAGPDPAVHGALSPAPPGMDDSGPSTPKGGLGSAVGVGAEKPHPDDLDGDGVHKLGEIGGTERIVPGRAGLTHPSSFAAVGPPPRSTGILRMWRKDERGKQWFRVSMRAGECEPGRLRAMMRIRLMAVWAAVSA
jgi:hypothetical protein